MRRTLSSDVLVARREETTTEREMTADGAAAAAEMVPERIVRRRTWIGVRWEDLGGEKRDG